MLSCCCFYVIFFRPNGRFVMNKYLYFWTWNLVIILLLYVWFEHPGHTYGGFVPAILERGMTRILPVKCYIDNFVRLRSWIQNINRHSRVAWEMLHEKLWPFCNMKRMIKWIIRSTAVLHDMDEWYPEDGSNDRYWVTESKSLSLGLRISF
jgi:hypothetical protein